MPPWPAGKPPQPGHEIVHDVAGEQPADGAALGHGEIDAVGVGSAGAALTYPHQVSIIIRVGGI